MQENSQGTFFLSRENLSLCYKVLVIKLYDGWDKNRQMDSYKGKNKIVGYIMYLLCIIYKGGIWPHLKLMPDELKI